MHLCCLSWPWASCDSYVIAHGYCIVYCTLCSWTVQHVYSYSWADLSVDVVSVVLDTLSVVSDRRILSKVWAILQHVPHPLHNALVKQRSSFNQRLIAPKCTTERHMKSFLPVAIKLYNSSLWWSDSFSYLYNKTNNINIHSHLIYNITTISLYIFLIVYYTLPFYYLFVFYCLLWYFILVYYNLNVYFNILFYLHLHLYCLFPFMLSKGHGMLVNSMGCVYNLFHIAKYEEEGFGCESPIQDTESVRLSQYTKFIEHKLPTCKILGSFWGLPKQTMNTALNIQKYDCKTCILLPFLSQVEVKWFSFLCTQNNYFFHIVSTHLLKSNKICHPPEKVWQIKMLIEQDSGTGVPCPSMVTSTPAPLWDAGDWMLVTSMECWWWNAVEQLHQQFRQQDYAVRPA